jgi:hypothetical protein
VWHIKKLIKQHDHYTGAGSHTTAVISMAFENMFETWKHEHTPSAIRTTDLRNKLINSISSRRDTLCHGIEMPAQQNCRIRK